MAVAASGAQQAVPVWAGVTTTPPPTTSRPASTAGLPASGKMVARASAAPSVSMPRRRPVSAGTARSQVRTVAAGTVAVDALDHHRQLVDGQRLGLGRHPFGVGDGVAGRHLRAGDVDHQREALAGPVRRSRTTVDRVDAPARLALDGDDAPVLELDVGLHRRLA